MPALSKEFLDIQATIKCGFTLKCNVTLQEHTVTIICLLKLQPILPQTSLLTRCKSFIRPHAVAVYDQPSTDQIRKCSVQCRFSNYGSNETKVHLAKHCIKNQGSNKEDRWNTFSYFTKLLQLKYQYISMILFLQ